MAGKVIVGISGGVDSAVAAFLLKELGYDVRAIFMRNWDDGGKYCTTNADFIEACKVCDHLKLELEQINFVKEYRQRVFNYCLDLFNQGMTPNPDVWCNSRIKFGVLLDAVADQTDWIATGHYARIVRDGDSYSLHQAVDKNKDQSYFLHQLNQQQLSRSLFPLGNWMKQAVRTKAKEIGLPNYDRPDSTGICFVGKRPFVEFLQEFLPLSPGEIVDENGKVIGQHIGLCFYTLGQRKGLKIGGRSNSSGEAWYVAAKNTQKNQLVAVQGESHMRLYSKSLLILNPHWISNTFDKNKGLSGKEFSAIVRHRQVLQSCSINIKKHGCADTNLGIYFKKPQKAVTPGQFAAVYYGTECIGGGMICNTSADEIAKWMNKS